ncbi:MAG: hypothetical protein LQ352_003904 [Teloschistes flavicans]|nr:MAG: hypothetical protein LQ352_003904 [Teloschistes flavicans]
MSTPAEYKKTWYEANCHCRLVKLRFRILPLYLSSSSEQHVFQPWNCNCSICTKNGYLNIYPTDQTNDIEWLAGKQELIRYEFGPKNTEHAFCPKCGSSIVLFVSLSVGPDDGEGERRRKVGINARMIKGIDIDRLTLKKANGKAKGDSYEEDE